MQGHLLQQTSLATLGKDVCLALYFAGCDFKCPFCFTPKLLQSSSEFLVDLKEIQKIIEQHRPYVTTVLFTGGEPLLQSSVVLALATLSKKHGLRVMLHTNGSKPHALKPLLEAHLLDGVILDFKSPLREDIFEQVTRSKTFFIPQQTIISNLQRTIALLEHYSPELDLEIRTTIVPGLLYKKEELSEIARTIAPLHARWVLQQFNPYKELASKTLQGVHEPSDHFMQSLKEALIKEFPQQWIDLQRMEDNYLNDFVVEIPHL